MTINTVVQVIGCKIKIRDFCSKFISDDGFEADYEYISDKQCEIINNLFQVRLFKLTHDIYPEEETDTHIIIGIPVQVYQIRKEFGFDLEENIISNIRDIIVAKKDVKEFIAFYDFNSVKIKMYTIVDDCGCCS